MIRVVAELGALEHGEAVFAASIPDKSKFLYDYSLGGGGEHGPRVLSGPLATHPHRGRTAGRKGDGS